MDPGEGSPQFVLETLAPDQVKVQVGNDLSAVFPVVDDHPVPGFRHPLLVGDPGGEPKHLAQDRHVLDSRLVQVDHVLLGNDKHVDRCHGVFVREGDQIVVLVNRLRRNLLPDDPAENTFVLV